MKKTSLWIIAVLLPLLSACSFVKLTDQGEKVRVLNMSEVSKCTLLGHTTANTQPTAVGVDRHPEVIQEELESLARNSASNLNGDTVVAEGGIKDGSQRFAVYRCVPE